MIPAPSLPPITLRHTGMDCRNDELELSGLGLTANQGWLMGPRMRYQVNDELLLALGGDYYAGDNNTIFGRLRDNRTVFMEVNYAFGVGSKL